MTNHLIYAETLSVTTNNNVVMTQKRQDNQDVITIKTKDKPIHAVSIKGVMNNSLIFEKSGVGDKTQVITIPITKEDVMLFNGQLHIKVTYDKGSDTIIKDNVIIDNEAPRVTHHMPEFIKDRWVGELIIEDATNGTYEQALITQYKLIVNDTIIEQKTNSKKGRLTIPLVIDMTKKTINNIAVSNEHNWNIQMEVIDNYGNKKQHVLRHLKHDTQSPIITKMSVKSGEQQKEVDRLHAQPPTLFANDEITLFADIIDNMSVDSAIIVLKDDVTNQLLYYMNDKWEPLQSITEAFEKGAVTVDQYKLEKTLMPPEQFKGSLFVIGKDKVGNVTPVNEALNIALVFESSKRHLENSHLDILFPDPITYSDTIPLYSSVPQVTITAQENFANVSILEWYITQDDKKLFQQVINVEEQLSHNDQEVNDTLRENITISYNNNIVSLTLNNLPVIQSERPLQFHVKTTNKVGNSREQHYNYIVDTISPTVNVTQSFNKQFNEAVAINIEIDEMYMDSVTLHGALENSVQSKKWERLNNKWAGQFIVQKEGYHKWGISVRDYAGNYTVYDGMPFVIDKTVPDIITTRYSKGNENFYRTPMRYHLLVSDINLYDVTINVIKDNKIIDVITFNQLNQRYETNFQFEQDGEYHIDVMAHDLAGNKHAVKDRFILDTKIDEFNNVGILDGQFYKWGPKAVLRGQDKYMLVKAVDIFYIEQNGRLTLVWQQQEHTNSPITYHLNDILKDEGYYRIKSSIVDRAGNEKINEQTILFSPSSLSFEPNMPLKQLMAQQVVRDNIVHHDIQVTVSSWVPFQHAYLIFMKDTNIIPIPYRTVIKKEAFQKEMRQFIVSKHFFEKDGEYELFIIASNMAKETVIPTKIVQFKKDSTPPRVTALIPMINDEQVYFELGDQFGIEMVSVFVNDDLILQHHVNGQKFYANTVTFQSKETPTTIKWILSDIYGNKGQHEYYIAAKSSEKQDIISSVHTLTDRNDRIVLNKPIPIWQVVVFSIIVWSSIGGYIYYKQYKKKK